MPTTIPTATLDRVLALQLTVAWAGEGGCDPRRLGWWQTDLVDEAGGGDLLARLTPRTAAWAGLEAVREAARRADAHARKQMSDPDRMRTLFFFGFEVDEKLADRLAVLKRGDRPPAEALGTHLPVDITRPFRAEDFANALRAPGGAHTIVPGGRQLESAPPASLELLVSHLTAALVPLADRYPLPFYKLPA